MMKRILHCAIALSVCATAAHAQNPWSAKGTKWYSSSKSTGAQKFSFVKTRLQDEPAVPEVDSESLPNPADEADHGAAPSAAHGDSIATDNNGDLNYSLYNDGCSDGSCDTAYMPHCGGCRWFGGVYAIGMTRKDNCDFTLSYDSADPSVAILNTGNSDIDYGGGAEIRFGKYLNDCWGVAAAYWGFYPGRSQSYAYNSSLAGELSSAIEFDGLEYDNGTVSGPLLDWFGQPGAAAQVHRLRRNFEAHNVEINLLRNPSRRSGGCVHYELIAGIRYLKLNDDLAFASDLNNDIFGDDLANELEYTIRTDNHLIGFQLGGRVDYRIFSCLGIHAGTKFGIYNNHMQSQQNIWGGNGFATVTASGDLYDVRETDDQVAFLGELFTGLSYDVTCSWRITGGYRAVVVSGVALTENQIPRNRDFEYMVNSNAPIDGNDSLILHGGYFGVEYNW